MRNETLELDDVAAFVANVRKHLADLSAEEQQELTEGLTADLGDQVAERGPEVLGDPAAYAAELRQAAGLETSRARGVRRPTGAGVTALLDRAHARWDALLAAAPYEPAGLLEALRPVWWVLRAWIAVEVVDVRFGGYPFGWIPSIFGLGWIVTLVAVLVSVQIGRGRLWPAPAEGAAWRRVLMLGLNLFAIAMLVPVVSLLPTSNDVSEAYDTRTYPSDAITQFGENVQNVFPYDAQGNPLVGVQLLDSNGRRLSVRPDDDGVVPWRNGRSRLLSVFPLATRDLDPDTGEFTGPPSITPPVASVPSVSLAGVTASVLVGAPPVPAG